MRKYDNINTTNTNNRPPRDENLENNHIKKAESIPKTAVLTEIRVIVVETMF